MSDNEVKVTGASIGGNFTGRDDNSTNFNITVNSSSYIHDLYEKFRKEVEADNSLKEICEEFNYYYSQVENETVVGLENKLLAANKPDYFIQYARNIKEKFHKKLLITTQYSLAAQDVNVYILAKIRRSFLMEIYQLIITGEDEVKINRLIAERIINPVKAELGANLFKYDEEDIMGMIFFLTGNCHIKWTA